MERRAVEEQGAYKIELGNKSKDFGHYAQYRPAAAITY